MWICTYYLQFSGSFFIFHFIFIYFHIDIVYECIVLRCIVENKLTYLLTYYTFTTWKMWFMIIIIT